MKTEILLKLSEIDFSAKLPMHLEGNLGSVLLGDEQNHLVIKSYIFFNFVQMKLLGGLFIIIPYMKCINI